MGFFGQYPIVNGTLSELSYLVMQEYSALQDSDINLISLNFKVTSVGETNSKITTYKIGKINKTIIQH